MDTTRALMLFQRLAELLEQGMTQKDIGQKLGLKPSEVSALSCLLPNNGRRQEHGLSESQKEKVLQLRIAGRTTEEIVNAFFKEEGEEVLLKEVRKVDQELYREKRFPYRIQTLQSERSGRDWWQENEKNVKEVIRLRQELYAYPEIANILGISYFKVFQEIAPRIVKRYGEGVFGPRPDNPCWTVAQAAEEVGLPKNVVQVMCRNGLIPCESRGLGMRPSYVLKREGIDALRNMFATP